MGDIDGGDAYLLLDAADLRAHGDPELGVQVGKGLIEQKHRGFDDQGPGQGHPLLLTAGELVGHTALHPRQLHQVKNGHNPFFDLGLRHLPQLQAVGHVVKHIVMGQQGVALEHHGRIPLVGSQGVDRLVPQIDFPFIGAFKAGDHAQRGGFAAAGGAKQRHERAGRNGQGGVFYGVEILSGLGVLIDLGNMLKPDAFFDLFHGLFFLLDFFTGAEVFHEQVHQQHSAIGNDDEDGGKGAGKAVGAFFRKLVDLHGDQ